MSQFVGNQLDIGRQLLDAERVSRGSAAPKALEPRAALAVAAGLLVKQAGVVLLGGQDLAPNLVANQHN